jgi:predicted nucleic acid-binding protein
MKKAVIDTCLLIDLFDGKAGVAKAISAFDRVFVPVEVIGEYRSGVDDSTRRGRVQEDRLADFLGDESVSVLDATEDTAGCYARLFRMLKARGKPLPTNDIWIAAAAICNGAALLTTDPHFREIPILDLPVCGT